jgi:hypothetical protein
MAAGVKRRGGGSLKIEDFLPEFAKETKKKITPEESEARLMAALKGAAAKNTPEDGKK